MQSARVSARKLALVLRGAAFIVLWWVLADGAPSSWWIGAPAIVLAAGLSLWLIPPMTIDWAAALRFIPFFLARSITGGLDVAWRAFHPRVPIAPDLLRYPLRLPAGLPQVLMVNTISLLPGTLIAELDEDHVTIHVLDGRKQYVAEIEAVESRVARMFRVSINEDR